MLRLLGEEPRELGWSEALFWRSQVVSALKRRFGSGSEHIAPDQRGYILGVEVDFALDYIRALIEWQEEIPVCMPFSTPG